MEVTNEWRQDLNLPKISTNFIRNIMLAKKIYIYINNILLRMVKLIYAIPR